MVTAVETYRSNDMALVTFLKLKGFSCQEVKWEERTCYWYFVMSDGLIAAADSFAAGAALVEPREYNKTFNQTKHEFYDSDPNEANRR